MSSTLSLVKELGDQVIKVIKENFENSENCDREVDLVIVGFMYRKVNEGHSLNELIHVRGMTGTMIAEVLRETLKEFKNEKPKIFKPHERN